MNLFIRNLLINSLCKKTPTTVKSSVTYRAKTRSFVFLLHKKKTHVATAMLTFFYFTKT
jgi:hypothetical protein